MVGSDPVFVYSVLDRRLPVIGRFRGHFSNKAARHWHDTRLESSSKSGTKSQYVQCLLFGIENDHSRCRESQHLLDLVDHRNQIQCTVFSSAIDLTEAKDAFPGF